MVAVLSKEVREEIKMWTGLLEVLCNGMPRPNDISFYVRRLRELESEGYDVDKLKECCLEESTIREVKDFKPIIFNIIERIRELTQLEERKKVSNEGYNRRF